MQAEYSTLTVYLLPPPFATQCSDYQNNNGSRKSCFNDCIDREVQKTFGKVPFNVPRVQSCDLRPVNGEDISNVTFTKILDALEDRCDIFCSRMTCIDHFYTTSLQKEEKDEFGVVSLQVTAPKAAEITVTNTPTLTFTDFFVYVTSCFGTWFGLSVLSFQPSNVWQLPHSKRETVGKCCCKFCNRLTQFLRQEVSLLRYQLMHK